MPDDMRMPSRPAYVPGTNGMGMPSSEMPSQGGSKKTMWIVVAIIVVVLVVLGVLFRDKLMGSAGSGAVKGASDKYSAVFLTNGQVYFGKLADINSDYVQLSDIFYLQVTTPPGLQGSQNQANATQQQQQQQLSLVKLGNELHGPQDLMRISRQQILFFEDLKADGNVVKAIQQYKANPNAGNTQAPAANTPAGTQSTTPAANTPAPANTK